MTEQAGVGPGWGPGVRVSGLIDRFDALVAPEARAAEPWPGLAVAHLDLAHLAVHLEGNDRHLAMGQVVSRALDAIADPDRCLRAAAALNRTSVVDGEWSPTTWAAEMSRRGTGRVFELRAEVAAATTEITGILTAIDHDRRVLVERLLGRTVSGHPAAVVAGALAAIADPEVRRKVVAAWHRLGQRRETDLVAAVDRVVAERRRHAAQEGHDSVVAQTFTRCRVDAADVERFLVDTLVRARRRHRDLVCQLAEATGANEAPLFRLPRAAALVRGEAPPPRLPLAGCVHAAATLAERVFGVELGNPRISCDGPWVLPVRTGTGVVGAIQVDLVPADAPGRRTINDNGAVGSATFRTAHVLALVDQGDHGPVLTFDAARSLFHEVGHALDHVLLAEPWPTLTGLDAQPLERLEEMSTWWELLAFHPDLGRVIGLDPGLAEGLDRARRLRVLEAGSMDLTRAWVALLDFRLHGSSCDSVADVQAELVAGQGELDSPSLSTLAGHLVAMVFRQHPGAGFLYPWAAARAAELTDDLLATPWEAMAPTMGTDALLRSRTSPRIPSLPPSPGALDALPEGVGM